MKPETTIQIQIAALLSTLARSWGFLYFAVPNEAFMMALAGTGLRKKDFARIGLLKKMGLTDGTSDLIIGHNGRMFCLEIKAPRGSQSEKQRLFESWCARVGVPYRIARSIEDALRALREWGIIP